MMRSLFAGVSGLKNHQTRMDVIGNNIANVNTPGYKKSRVTFQDMLSQTLRGASNPTSGRAGTNPMQVGLGMSLSSIDVIHGPGSPQSTGKNTDLAIEGEGFFILRNGDNVFYTRAGNFDFDTNKNFYNTSNGMIVEGYLLDPDTGKLKESREPLNLAQFSSCKPKATSFADFAKNIDSNEEANGPQTGKMVHTTGTDTVLDVGKPFKNVDAATLPATAVIDYTAGTITIPASEADGTFNPVYSCYDSQKTINHTSGTDTVIELGKPIMEITGLPASAIVDYTTGKITIPASEPDIAAGSIKYTNADYQRTMVVHDSLGNTHEMIVQYLKTADNEWQIQTICDFDASDGKTPAATGKGTLTFNSDGTFENSTVNALALSPTGADPMNITLDFSKLTQHAEEYTVVPFSENGYAAGSLDELSVDTSGVITGSYSNGEKMKLAQVATATFANPAGLVKMGSNLFQESNNSGIADVGKPAEGGRGSIKPESLEMSNVDLSQEFVDMIVTQRGFQANSRIITTSDQMLEELVNLKR